MADILGINVDIAGTFSTATDYFYWGFILIFGLAVLIGIIWLIWFIAQFKHRIRIKTRTGSKKIVKDYKFRTVEKKLDGRWWQVWGLWKWLPPAPADSIDVTAKGRMSVEMEFTEDGEYYWIESQIAEEDVKRLGLGELVEKKLWLFGTKIVRSIAPKGRYVYVQHLGEPVRASDAFDNLQRGQYIAQLEKAHARKKRNLLLENIGTIAGVTACIILVALFIFGGEEIFKPALAAQKTYADMNVRLARIEQSCEVQTITAPNITPVIGG
jgi:hypothetical protein